MRRRGSHHFFLEKLLTDSGKVVRLTHLYPQEDSWYSFLPEAVSPPKAIVRLEGLVQSLSLDSLSIFQVIGSLYYATYVPCIRKKLALTSPTSGCLSVGIVRSQTQATEFFYIRDIPISEGRERKGTIKVYSVPSVSGISGTTKLIRLSSLGCYSFPLNSLL
jgi:hypothetical protein